MLAHKALNNSLTSPSQTFSFPDTLCLVLLAATVLASLSIHQFAAHILTTGT